MREDILKCVGQLESIDVAQAELNMRIHDELGETKNFSAQMERVSEAGFLALLGGQGPEKIISKTKEKQQSRYILDGLQVHVVIQMKVIQILEQDNQR